MNRPICMIYKASIGPKYGHYEALIRPRYLHYQSVNRPICMIYEASIGPKYGHYEALSRPSGVKASSVLGLSVGTRKLREGLNLEYSDT